MGSEVAVALISAFAVMFAATIPLIKWVVDRSTARAAETVLTKNSSEHKINKVVLDRIERKVDGLHDVVTGHLNWHVGNPPDNRRKGAA